MSVFATRCDTAAAWLLGTWSSGRTSLDAAGAAAVLLTGSAVGLRSCAGSRWQAEAMVTRATMAAIRMVVGRDACGAPASGGGAGSATADPRLSLHAPLLRRWFV